MDQAVIPVVRVFPRFKEQDLARAPTFMCGVSVQPQRAMREPGVPAATLTNGGIS